MTHEYWRFVNKLSQDIESALGSALVSTIDSITATIQAHTADKKQALDCMLVAMCRRS
jgi:hypothetical protein